MYSTHFAEFQGKAVPDSKVPGANMWPIWGRQDPGGPHVGPMNFTIWVRNLVNEIPSMWLYIAIGYVTVSVPRYLQ